MGALLGISCVGLKLSIKNNNPFVLSLSSFFAMSEA